MFAIQVRRLSSYFAVVPVCEYLSRFLVDSFFLHFPFWPLCFAFDQAPRVVRHRVGEGRSRARVRHPAAEHLLDGTRHQGHGKLNLFTWYLVRYRVALHPLLEPLWDCTRVCRD